MCDSEQLILEVQRRPELYDMKLPGYSDRNKKNKLWQEVCKAVIASWDDLDSAARNKKGAINNTRFIKTIHTQIYKETQFVIRNRQTKYI